jgi:hypothetical protein
MNPNDLRDRLASVVADLRARRLLPILLLLIAAAVAIPLLLSKSGKPANLAPLPPAPSVTAPSPVASTSSSHRHEPSQNYLTGPSHDPFVSTTATPSAASTRTSSSVSASVSTTATTRSPGTPTAGTSHAATTATTRSPAASTVTVTTPATTKTVSTTTTVPAKPGPYTNYQVEVSLLQQGVATTPTVFHNLARDQLLPTDTDPFSTFLGVRTDKQTAVFVLTSDTTVTGSGDCAPSATQCTFLTLTPGEGVTAVVTPSGGAPSTFTLRYVKLTKVVSNASTVTVDPTGATDIKAASAYVSQLKTIAYAQYTGLLSIDLGSTVPATS